MRDLTEVGLERWFEIDSAAACEADIARLRELITSDEVTQPFRSVLLDADRRVRARIAGYITASGRLTFWAVRHALCADMDARLQAAHRLVETCVARARATTAVRYLETKPAHDTPDLESFLAALRDEDFNEVAAAHLHVRELATLPPQLERETELGLRLSPARTLAPDVLEQLFEACQVGTLDRAQCDSPLSARETLAELRHLAGTAAETELWSVAFVDDEPVGFALCAASGDLEVAAEDAVLVELGVVPGRRRARIGLRLVSAMLEALRRRGAMRIEAVIDEKNLPSLRLHEALGFVREPGTYWTWRKRL